MPPGSRDNGKELAAAAEKLGAAMAAADNEELDALVQRIETRGCAYCLGDCAGANPPVPDWQCDKREDQRIVAAIRSLRTRLEAAESRIAELERQVQLEHEDTEIHREAADQWSEVAVGREDKSGRILVRMPRSMHTSLSNRALKEGVSLNHLIVHLLSCAELAESQLQQVKADAALALADRLDSYYKDEAGNYLYADHLVGEAASMLRALAANPQQITGESKVAMCPDNGRHSISNSEESAATEQVAHPNPQQRQ